MDDMIVTETNRLILRQWREEDIALFAEMNADPEVMEYLPKCLTSDENMDFYLRIVSELETCGYGLYAVELRETGEFIGYTGFHRFDFQADFSPGIEIGWRLARRHWGRGYATEAARACIEYARTHDLFGEIYSFTAVCNRRSERVMQKAGMLHHGYFQHPSLPDGHRLKPHTVYRHVLRDKS